MRNIKIASEAGVKCNLYAHFVKTLMYRNSYTELLMCLRMHIMEPQLKYNYFV